MAIRTVAQVAAGVLAGAVLAGVPAWAMASQDDVPSGMRADMSQVMSGSQSPDQMMSGSQSTDQMMTSMSKMMKDPAMRQAMDSMMSEARGQMPGMGADDSDQGMSGMGRMHGMDPSDASSGATKP